MQVLAQIRVATGEVLWGFMGTNSNRVRVGSRTTPKHNGSTDLRPTAIAIIACLLLISTPNCRFFRRQGAVLPDQRQSEGRVQEISRLELQRQGRIRFGTILLERQGTGKERWKVQYRLQSPISETADVNVRGFLDGSVKYAFNQATAYHNRVGRRYSGLYKGELELMRTLMRWQLPPGPQTFG